MKRIAVALILIIGLAASLTGGVAAGGDDGAYEVRAIFDNGGFLTKGEEVRVAGANVGSVADVDVTDNDEPAHEDGSPAPGKAVVVMRIEDPAFQDFRRDASCLIRPQSLLGEKFVECTPTQPHAPGTQPPPALNKVADGNPGAGQRFLPLESNGKAVDLDLVNNIQRLPYAERFRLILNDLGAAFAGRGQDLGEVIDRADPALRATDQVLAKIATQNRRLEQLAVDGDRSLTPLARDRERITGFLRNANEAAAATAEVKPQFEAGLQKLPGFLRELRVTMPRLRAFADQAQPAFADLGAAAPAATRATKALGPFSRAGIPAITSLGDATDQAVGPLTGSDPVVRQLRDLARSGKSPTRNLKTLLTSTRKTRGFEYIDELLFNGVGVTNLFDNFGHVLRTVLPNNNCVDYVIKGSVTCSVRFGTGTAANGRILNSSKVPRSYPANTLDDLPTPATPNLKDVAGLLDYVYGGGEAVVDGQGTSQGPDAGSDAAQPSAGQAPDDAAANASFKGEGQ